MPQAECVLTIERLASDGSAMAHAEDGRIVFVHGAAPADRIRARMVEGRRKWGRAEIIEVLQPGPDRVQPECPAFGRCGGCAWQHLAYPAQLAAKASILKDALGRIGGFELSEEVSVTPSPQAYGYRGRARILVHRHRPGYRRAASDEHVAIDDCPVLAPPLRAALRDLAASQPANGEWELALGEVDPAHPEGCRVQRLDDRAPADQPLSLRAGAHRIEIAAGGFAQANPLLFDALIHAVARAVGEGEDLLELYAGAGFFTLSLAGQFQRIRAVESDATALANLRRAAAAAGIDHIEARAVDVETFLLQDPSAHALPRVLFVDPPRAGLGAAVTSRLCAAGPERLVYLSCDPATLARDLGQLRDGGWQLQSVEGFDLFPQTPHLESLVVMTR